jgi:uncharacterized RDD family membrane protein YckC
MKTGLTVAFAAFALIAALLFIAAFPLMLVLGALHGSDGMSWVPALGFWQTLGSLFVFSTFGSAFNNTKPTAKVTTK